MLESGLKISNLPTIPINGENCKFKNKIGLENTFFLSYAHSTYGINYNKQNYKVPLGALREDFRGYIGLESLVAPWSEQLKLWHGYWNNVNKNKSYVYVWKTSERNHEHYAPQKFCDLENSYYIIKDAPFPFETENLNNRNKGEKTSHELIEGVGYCNDSINTPIKAFDPHPDSNKIVTKDYIDERLAGKRSIEVGTDFYVRDYDCAYIIRATEFSDSDFDNIIKVHFPESYNEKSLHNKLSFTILIEGIKNNNKWDPPSTKIIDWEFYDFNGKAITPTWLNNKTNIPPNINDESLYGNARYLIFRVETTTAEIEATPVYEQTEAGNIVTSYNTTAIYDVAVICENLLYRTNEIDIPEIEIPEIPGLKSDDGSIIIKEKGNDSDGFYWDLSVDMSKIPEIPEIEIPEIPKIPELNSDDGTINIDKVEDNDGFYWNLSVTEKAMNPKSYIEELSEEIDLSSARNKLFWVKGTEGTNPKINIKNNNNDDIDQEVITFDLLYNVVEDSLIGVDANYPNIIWPMCEGGTSPNFIKGRIYSITFTVICANEESKPFNDITIFAKINWFIDSTHVNWS